MSNTKRNETNEEVKGAHRSPDNQSKEVAPKGNRYEKTFVTTRKSGWSGTEAQHEANKAATLSEALNNGAHPLGEATFDGEEDHPDGQSLYVNYSVEVKPVEETPTSAETLAPSQSENVKDN